jgi:hypothetical protein
MAAKSSSYIVSIGTAVPLYSYQYTIADFMIRYFSLNDEAAERFHSYIIRRELRIVIRCCRIFYECSSRLLNRQKKSIAE